LPFELRQAVKSAGCVLFVGAGPAVHFWTRMENSSPKASQLGAVRADFFGIDVESRTDLINISQVGEIREREPHYRRICISLFGVFERGRAG
jgi:hypothetical protein